MTLNLSSLKRLGERFSGSRMKDAISQAMRERAVAALVGQAIADNFSKEGPGWAPLKAGTIRASLSKKLKKSIADMSDEELLKYEKKARQKESEEVPNRRILQRTNLLMKTATIPGYSGTSKGKKPVSGANIYKVEGTKLIWGTDLIYAGVHNKGNAKKRIPKREFLVIRPEWNKQIQEFVFKRALKFVKSVVGGT